MKSILSSEICRLSSTAESSGCTHKYGDYLTIRAKKALNELDMFHNNSIAVELYRRNENNFDAPALFYRGSEISYGLMFDKAEIYARALKSLGFNKGSEIPVCMSNMPEFVYLFLAASFIGAKINIIGAWFDSKYTVQILNSSRSKYVFVSDDEWGMIKDKVEHSDIDAVIVFSLADSLPVDSSGYHYDPFENYDIKFRPIKKLLGLSDNSNKRIIPPEEFEAHGAEYNGAIVESCSLDDGFAVTYTSGTTSPGVPKAVLHAVRSYLTMARFKEADVSGMPPMKNMRVMAHIPTYTHMDITGGIVEPLYMRCTVALEPYYSAYFFPYSLLINRPDYSPGSVGAWLRLCDSLENSPEFKEKSFGWLMLPVITGEGASIGEEYYLNKIARKYRFGVDKLPIPAVFSIGGGTTEGSGIFTTLYKAWQEKLPKYFLRGIKLAQTAFCLAEVEVLNDAGDYCKVGEPGLLVGNSPCTMMGYYYQPELTSAAYITDIKGKRWISYGTYAYKSDKYGHIAMKGRPGSYVTCSSGKRIPYYEIEDSVLRDYKNIQSCVCVKTSENMLVLHIRFQPDIQQDEQVILSRSLTNLRNTFDCEILDRLYYKIHRADQPFALAPSGKRDISVLERDINEIYPVMQKSESTVR